MDDKYCREYYVMLRIYKRYHWSYRYFKKEYLKRLNEYKKLLSKAVKWTSGEEAPNLLEKKV